MICLPVVQECGAMSDLEDKEGEVSLLKLD
jgi:hypothetical protein